MRLVRLVSVTAVATATCALWALPASAATAVVHRRPSTTTVSVPASVWAGASVKLSAKVSSSGQTPTGTVTFMTAGTRLCIARLSRGAAACSSSFGPGGYIVRGFYSGDRTHAPSVGAATLTARRSPTTTSVSANPSTALVGMPVRLSATVRSRVGTPTGVVTFTWNGARLCVATLLHGSGSCLARFSTARTYVVQGTYARNSRYLGSSGLARVRIVIPPPPPPPPHATTTTITNPSPGSVLAGNPFTVNVTVTSASGTPTGTVVVAPTSPAGLPASYSCTATLTAGKGSCQVTPGAGTFGDIFYEATYSGDATHTKSVSTGTHELIVPETTTTSVTPATAAHGSVTLTATVIGQAKSNISPSAGGTGTVTFTITQGSTTVATCSKAALTYNGAGANLATCTATLAASTTAYTVTAVYSGDPNNLTSTGTESLTVS